METGEGRREGGERVCVCAHDKPRIFIFHFIFFINNMGKSPTLPPSFLLFRWWDPEVSHLLLTAQAIGRRRGGEGRRKRGGGRGGGRRGEEEGGGGGGGVMVEEEEEEGEGEEGDDDEEEEG